MNLWEDVRFALRTMWKSPRITATVLLTLALGIGANTAIFSVVNATLFRPLPFHDPEQLVVLHADLRGLGAQSVGFSVPEFDDLRDRAGVLSAVSVIYQGPSNVTGGEHPERLESGVVSPNYFSILGARPQLGRLFDPGDTAPGFADAVVITDGLWHREFGGESSVLGIKCGSIPICTPSWAYFRRTFGIPHRLALFRWRYTSPRAFAAIRFRRRSVARDFCRASSAG